MREVYEFLKECGVYYLATIDADRPRVRPFGTAFIFEDKLYIQTGKKKDVSRQIAKNPHVEISAALGNRWLRLEATVVEDDRLEAREAMLDAYPSLRGMYSEADGNTQALYLRDAKAVIYSFDGEPKEFRF